MTLLNLGTRLKKLACPKKVNDQLSQRRGSQIAIFENLFADMLNARKKIVKDLLSFADVATMSSVPIREYLF